MAHHEKLPLSMAGRCYQRQPALWFPVVLPGSLPWSLPLTCLGLVGMESPESPWQISHLEALRPACQKELLISGH